jgi:hypothetical protein
MNGDQDDPGAYVRRLRAETQQYVQELLLDNQRLRSALRVQEEMLKRLELEVQASDAVSRREQERFLELEQNNSNLANLYVASYRLLSTLRRPDVLLAIQEVIANLIGSEEFGVYELDRNSDTLELVSSFGVEANKHRRVALGSGVIGESVRSRRLFRADEGNQAASAEAGHVLACIPLLVDDRLIGAIVIFRLLQHKPRLLPVDGELLTLLGTHAATALCCARLLAETGAP